MRFVVLALMALCARADSIEVEITPGREAIVHERFSQSGSFVFLASECARIEKLQSGSGNPLELLGTGPWINVAVPQIRPVELSYRVVPAVALPRSCDVPLVMPKRPIDSVSITITDQGSGLSGVAIPQLARTSESTWTGTFPAVPSRVRLEWPRGNAPEAANGGPVGLFFWNFWGLVVVLVTWTFAYLVWASRQASS